MTYQLRRFAAALFALALLAGACSSRDDDTTTTDSSVEESDAGTQDDGEAMDDEAMDDGEAMDDEGDGEAMDDEGDGEAMEEALEATDVGITETEIRIGVIADIDTPVAPGLSQPIHDGAQAWADEINANGGLAGRQVVLTLYDSKLNPDESTNVVIEACQSEFALVGSGIFSLLNPAPMIECADMNGDATGLPDIAALAVSPGQAASPTTFPLLPVGRDFSAEVPTYNVPLYGAPYIEELLGDVTPNVLVIEPGTPGLRPGAVAQSEAYAARGWDTAGVVTYVDSAAQSEATPIVNQIRDEGVNVVYAISFSVAKVMAEARVQGIDVDAITWICTSQCLSPGFGAAFGEPANGLIVSQLNAPYVDTDVPAIATYAGALTPPQISGNGLLAFGAGKAFEEIVAGIVEADGVNGLTRASVLGALRSGPEVTAAGILAEGSVLGQQNPCWVTAQLVDGAYQRVDPAGQGTFRCDEAVLATVVDPQE